MKNKNHLDQRVVRGIGGDAYLVRSVKDVEGKDFLEVYSVTKGDDDYEYNDGDWLCDIDCVIGDYDDLILDAIDAELDQ